MPNSFQEVNENGPKLYTEGGRTYLMGGSNAGNVVPIRGAHGNVTNINVNVRPTVSNKTADQVAMEVARGQRIAASRNG